MVLATPQIEATVLPARPEQKTHQSAGIVEVLPLDVALQRIEPEWRRLEQAVASPSVFQGAGWAQTVLNWRQGNKTTRGHQDGFVLTSRSPGGRLIGLWPLQITRHAGVALATGLGDPFNQYSDILIHPDADPESVMHAMLETLRSIGKISGVLIRKVRDDAAAARFLAANGTPVGSPAAAPQVDLRPFDTFDAYHSTVKSKTRKNLRNARNRLERSGPPLQHLVYETHEDIAAALDRSFTLRADWLKQEGMTSRAFLDVGFARFVEAAGAAHGRDLDLLAFELRQDDTMLSIQWGFVHNGRYYAFIASRNPAFDAHSPGRMHLEHVIRSCAERGIDVVDFLAPDVDYKRTWATETTGIRDYAIPFNARGRMVIALQSGAPQRIAKTAIRRLPDGLRHRVLKVIARVYGAH